MLLHQMEMMQYVPNALKVRYGKKFFLQLLGVDYDTFVPSTTFDAQKRLGLEQGNYINYFHINL